VSSGSIKTKEMSRERPLEHERHMITRKDVETNKGGEQYILENEQAEKLIARKVSTLTHLPDTLLTTAVDQGKIR
jgi:hypothetical protein